MIKLFKKLKETRDINRWKKFQAKHKKSLEVQLDEYKRELRLLQEDIYFSLVEHKYRTLFIGKADIGMYHRAWNDYTTQLQSLKIETLELKINHLEYLLENEPILK